jgi:mannose-6-phosphate isomerase
MTLTLTSTNKPALLAEVEEFLVQSGLRVTSKDWERPWGGFFVIDENQAGDFASLYFPGVELSTLQISGKLSPKILVVQPNKRLSWQYHHRRAEIWRLIAGTAGVVTSLTDQEQDNRQLQIGDTVRLAQGQRHRLMGLNGWGVIAEIWQHTTIGHPSDEDDIVRLQDDFGR